jgi:glycosyltransferase involved in cell wall biosynthesis
MIKICHLAEHLNGEMDGVYNHIKMIIKESNAQKFEHYLCFQGNKKIEDEIISLGGKIIILPELSFKLPFFAVLKFIAIIKEFNIQIIHTHFLKSYIIAGITNIILCKNVIYNYHGLFINNEFYGAFKRLLYKLSHFMICLLKGVQIALVPSKESKNQLLAETRLFPNVYQYYNGAESYSATNQIDKDLATNINVVKEFKFVFVGRIESEKRLDRAIEFIYRLEQHNIIAHLFIMGDGIKKNNIVDLVRNYRLEEAVSFLGIVQNPEDYFKYFDCLLLTSDREGLPFVIWESMAEGLPILSTSVGGITEILTDVNCGMIFDKENISDAVEKAKLLIKDKSIRDKLGLNGKRAIADEYNVEHFKKFIDNLYSDLNSVKPTA